MVLCDDGSDDGTLRSSRSGEERSANPPAPTSAQVGRGRRSQLGCERSERTLVAIAHADDLAHAIGCPPGPDHARANRIVCSRRARRSDRLAWRSRHHANLGGCTAPARSRRWPIRRFCSAATRFIGPAAIASKRLLEVSTSTGEWRRYGRILVSIEPSALIDTRESAFATRAFAPGRGGPRDDVLRCGGRGTRNFSGSKRGAAGAASPPVFVAQTGAALGRRAPVLLGQLIRRGRLRLDRATLKVWVHRLGERSTPARCGGLRLVTRLRNRMLGSDSRASSGSNGRRTRSTVR